MGNKICNHVYLPEDDGKESSTATCVLCGMFVVRIHTSDIAGLGIAKALKSFTPIKK